MLPIRNRLDLTDHLSPFGSLFTALTVVYISVATGSRFVLATQLLEQYSVVSTLRFFGLPWLISVGDEAPESVG